MSRLAVRIVPYIPRLRRYARALTGDAEQAEDLVQETLARALGRLHLWRRDSNLRAWLFSIMHNLFINDCRRQSNRPDGQRLDERAPPSLAASSAETQAVFHDVEQALQQLSEEQRAVVLLVSLEGLSYDETARVLGIRKGTVMSRLHRARERLRHSLLASPAGNIESIRSMK